MDKCVGCKWHMPRKLGGGGIICDRKSMVVLRCPEWVINYWRESNPKEQYSVEAVIASNQL